jgi:hypothetical protein
MWRWAPPCAAVGALLLFPALPGRAADTSAILADGRTLERVNLKNGTAPDQIILEQTGKPDITATVQDLLVVDFGKTPTRPMPASVRLANGDQVVGKVSFPSARQVKVAADWGAVTVPLSWCTAIRLNDKAPVPGTVTKDTLFLENDRIEGEIQSLTATKININLGASVASIDMARVRAIAFPAREHPQESRSSPQLAIDLGGGERLTGRWSKLTPDVLTVRTDWGDSLDIPVGSISRLEVKNGKLVYLSDLKPAEIKQTPFVEATGSAAHPLFVPDRTVTGRPLRLRGKTYSRGLGTHSRCEVTYALDGGYQTFSSTLGIDDAVGPEGSVIYRVYGDDKPLFESPIVRGGDDPLEMKVNVKGVLLLRIEVDYADDGDAADLADWAEARLLRQ